MDELQESKKLAAISAIENARRANDHKSVEEYGDAFSGNPYLPVPNVAGKFPAKAHLLATIASIRSMSLEDAVELCRHYGVQENVVCCAVERRSEASPEEMRYFQSKAKGAAPSYHEDYVVDMRSRILKRALLEYIGAHKCKGLIDSVNDPHSRSSSTMT